MLCHVLLNASSVITLLLKNVISLLLNGCLIYKRFFTFTVVS